MALQPPPPPVPGPSTAQLPTQLLLNGLADAHSLYFPKRHHLVQPDTQEITTHEQRQDAEQKIALLKSVLSGWMQGVELDLDRTSSDLAATFENLVALAETLPGSFSGIKAKPRFLLYTTSRSPSSSSASRVPPTPSLLNGSPKKKGGAVPPAPTNVTDSALAVEGLNPEEDLATFLLWRSLSVSTALQASLLAPSDGVISEVEKKVRAQRQIALNELEGLVKGVVNVLCESAVRVEWKGGGITKDLLKEGGVGKAKGLVEELLKTVQALVPSPNTPPPAYPRTHTFFDSSRAYQSQPFLRSPSKTAAAAPPPALSCPRQPSLTLKSPLHAQSLALVALRILITVTAENPHLAAYRPLVTDLLSASWPSPAALRPRQVQPESRNGKERAHRHGSEELEEAHERVLRARAALVAQWLDLVGKVMDERVEVWKGREAEALTLKVLEEFREQLEVGGGRDRLLAGGGGGGGGGALEKLREEGEAAMLNVVARLWARAKEEGSTDGTEAGQSETLQLLSRFFEAEGRRIVDFSLSEGAGVAINMSTILLLSLPLFSSSSPSAPSSHGPTALDSLPPSALAILDSVLAIQVEPPLPSPLPPPLEPFSELVAVAWSALVADHDQRHPPLAATEEGEDSTAPVSAIATRKRRWLDDADAPPPSSDGAMDIDGGGAPSSTMATTKRRRGPWKEAVGRVMANARREAKEREGGEAAKVFELEGEAAEATVVRLAHSFESVNSLKTALIMLCTIGHLACARSGCLVFPSSILPFPSSASFSSAAPSCTNCDVFTSSPPLAPLRTFTHDPLDALVAVTPKLLNIATNSKDEKFRLATLNALGRVLRHTSAEAAARLVENGEFANALERELAGATRSGRMAAGNVLIAIVQGMQEYNGGSDVKDVFIGLDSLFARDSAAITETTLQTTGKLARMAEPQGLLECESLVRILARLGHRNAFIKTAAKLQLGQTAQHRGIKPYALVQPHFAVLSPVLLTSTATLSAALECFHQSRESLLRVTREHTLPNIILRDQRTLLKQVADASNTDIPQMLCDPPVASAIVAHLYMQPDEGRQRGLATLTRETKGVVFGKLLESINIPLVYKLALELGNEDPRVAAQAERALKNAERARVGHSPSARIEVSDILKNAIVGLLSHMSRGLHDAAHHRPLRDKQKIIRALDVITTTVGRGIAGFSPQIMATLQTALELPGLRLVTLNAFGSFLRSLKFSDIGPFMGPTTAAFVRLWPDLTEAERSAAKMTIEYLVVENAASLQVHLKDVADLSRIEGLEAANGILVRARTSWSLETRCTHLLDRIAGENDVVTLQALRELKVVLEKSTKAIRALSAGDSFNPFVGRTVAVLLGAAVKDGPENELVRNTAFECIGILGALDPDRFELPPVEQSPVVLENFLNTAEAVDFALRLIQDLLVGAYRSTNDTKHQEFLAYAIQELLRFCGFTANLILAPDANMPPTDQVAFARWRALPKTVVEACAPLLSTRFSLGNLKAMPPAQYPIYSSTTVYRDWVRSFANDLLQKVQGSTAKQVFNAFSGLLHLEDTVVAQQLLPHLLLNVVICGTDDSRMKIKQEIETVLTDQVSPTHVLSENSRLLSAQTVFTLMDHLSRWITLARKRSAELKSSRSKKTKSRAPIEQALVEGLLVVEGILQDIPHILVGQAALTCKSYARSLLNFEAHIVAQRAQKKGNDKDKDLQVYYENLHECYAHLDEPDGMEGISTKILLPSVLHQIREHESTGRWTSAQSCWEVKLQQKPDDPVNHVGLLRCLRNLGHYDSMRTHIVGLLHSRGDEVDWERVLAPFNIEASLFVGDWDSVEDALDIVDLEGPEAAFGRVFCAMRDGDDAAVERAFYEAREQLGGPIVAAGRESYRRVYDSVIHLHVLDELKAIHGVHLQSGSQPLQSLVKTFKDRLAATSPSFRAREPILNLRRTAFRLAPTLDASARAEVGELWLETSKIARKAGHSQTAYSAILQARDCRTEFAFFQSAKLFKSTGQTHKAIQELDNCLKPLLSRFEGFKDVPDALVSPDHASPLAKASLRRVRWLLETGRIDENEAVVEFNKVTAIAPGWEAGYYYLGHFWDNMAEQREKKLPKHKQGRTIHHGNINLRPQTVKLFLRSLNAGTKFIYQALPRLLTIWLEIGERQVVAEYVKAKKTNPELALPDGESRDLVKTFQAIDKNISTSVKQLPVYQWLTVLPQLVSRILHVNDGIHETLVKILTEVLMHYPHHGFWAMASGAKSNTNKRSKRNLRVFQRAKAEAAATRSGPAEVNVIVDEGLRLVDQLLHLCDFAIANKVDTLSLRKTFPNLHKTAPSSLIIPLQSSLTVSLPFDASQAATHKPFPPSLPVFQEYDDVITIMSSLQKPRKITIRGDDDVRYSFLCKPKDDLRKDARLMEFNSMIIKLLKKDSDARSRKLNIRTYSVVPLNEECGLIEWVPHVVVLRTVLTKAYAAKGIPGWSPELKKTFDTIRDDPKKTAARFEKEVLSQFPSVFHGWFLENFPEPSAWHRARLAYARTAAVISMVGFVLGLGDRHCENILLDSTTGDTVHVDFNCLFDKGRTFEVGEQVPFRLSHNIVDGMGVTGVEGVFRRSAENTLRILRANKDSLRSVLETFMHDPLVEWSYASKKKESGNQPDQTKAKALEALEPIANKLLGLQVTSDPKSLSAKEVSIEEQVERLIREARDYKNLGSMYVGWCSWF